MAVPVEPAATDLEALANPTPPAAPVPAVVDPVLPAPPGSSRATNGPARCTTRTVERGSLEFCAFFPFSF